jgi:hypothetical protein
MKIYYIQTEIHIFSYISLQCQTFVAHSEKLINVFHGLSASSLHILLGLSSLIGSRQTATVSLPLSCDDTTIFYMQSFLSIANYYQNESIPY